MTTKTYILFFLLAHSYILLPQTPDLQFEHLTVEEGLSHNHVTSIIQDSSGFMWFGTLEGLNRWDGHTFKFFNWDPTDSNSLSTFQVWALLQASSGKIWVGTGGGLNLYDPGTEKFTRYEFDENNPNSLSHDYIHDLYQDKSGNLWIATYFGLNRYNPDSNNFTRFIPDSGETEQNRSYNLIESLYPYQDGKILLGTTAGLLIFDPNTTQFERVPCPYEIPENPVVTWWWPIDKIITDHQGLLWVGMRSGGLVKFDLESGHAQVFSHDFAKPPNFSANNVTALCETRDGILWAGTSVAGLNRLDPGSQRFTVYKHNDKDNKSLSSSQISALYEDKQGNLWIGTWDKGVNLLAKWRKQFHRYPNDPADPNSIGDCEITDICEDHQGNLCIATYGCNLSVMNPKTGNITKYVKDVNDPKSISQAYIRSVYCDHSGTLWIGARKLNRLDPLTNGFIKYQNDPNDPHSHVYASIIAFYEDRDGTLWIGTDGEGLERFDRSRETFHRYPHDTKKPYNFIDKFVFSIYQDHLGILWFSTTIGLCRYHMDGNGNERFFAYRHNASDPYHFSRDATYDIHEDTNGQLWLATNSGLSLFDREGDSIRVFRARKDYPLNFPVYIIREDDHKNLWLRTNQGLVKFNPENRSYRIYDERDGLINCKSVYAGIRAFCQSKAGIMYYGCANDIVYFHPDSIKENPDKPKVQLTNFLLFNHPMPIGPQSVLKKSITLTKTIHLSYNQNNISFEFSALDFTAPDKNQYAYKMDGIENEWVYCENRNYANYTNLDPGQYIFQVKGSNNDGVWNEVGTSVTIIITPPWWKTNWVYGLYLLLIVSLIYGIYRFQMNRIKMTHQLEMEHLHAEKLEEVDRMKSHFFANISHEFRTPLTLILGPMERLLTRYVDEDSHQELKIMQRSALRLHRLINQLLDLSKLEAGRMTLQVRQENIINLLRSFVQAFESQAKMKNIQLFFKADRNNISGYIDREKLETIVNNLLSNSFKFTPEGGKVTVKMFNPHSISPLYIRGEKGGAVRCIQISVSDTGSGIPADSLPHIFDRFYQADNSYTRDEEGSGIGLALTKELVEFHKGKISVSSELGKGTTFIIWLPLAKEYYTAEEIVDLDEADDRGNRRLETGDRKLEIFPESNRRERPIGKKIKASRKSLPIVLIVEDNADMRTYIRTNLENAYRIIEAEDGEKGFKKSATALPDLVISDVMMPKMDGFQLCAKLKTDQRTSHIPVVLLTARAAAEDRIGGLETGADDYIIKPFNARELLVRVRNLIEQRRKLRERYRKEGILKPQDIAVTSTDQKFLQRALEIIESHFSDENFGVEAFGREIGMSRVQLHRKLRALTDHSTGQFIRTLRLNRAARLLAKHHGNVTEVAYEVGFKNLSYFAKCFHEQFGVNPHAYAVHSSSISDEGEEDHVKM
jgi:signal transduction histidine kinase/ligand-binding sensor domain-containing protein/DNA-binding response OmpR family regulator